jgi:hypothetical protein
MVLHKTRRDVGDDLVAEERPTHVSDLATQWLVCARRAGPRSA